MTKAISMPCVCLSYPYSTNRIFVDFKHINVCVFSFLIMIFKMFHNIYFQVFS